jgi:hypothetical protein
MKVYTVNWFESVNVTDMDHWPNLLHLTYKSLLQYCSSSLGGYQFVHQEILYLPLFYILSYNQYVM